MQDRIFLGLSLRRRLIHVAWAVYYLAFVIICFAIRRSIPSIELLGIIFVCLLIVLQLNPTARLHVAIQRWLYNGLGKIAHLSEQGAIGNRQKDTP